MPKKFYTEKDIEDMFKSGILSLEVGENVVLTELAYEKANSMGMRLVQNQPDNPPCAPIRPYLSRKPDQPASTCAAPSGSVPRSPEHNAYTDRAESIGLPERIRNAVQARLGNQVDANLLDVIIKRVLNSTGVKEPVCCSPESGAPRCAPSSTAEPRG